MHDCSPIKLRKAVKCSSYPAPRSSRRSNLPMLLRIIPKAADRKVFDARGIAFHVVTGGNQTRRRRWLRCGAVATSVRADGRPAWVAQAMHSSAASPLTPSQECDQDGPRSSSACSRRAVEDG